VLAGRTDAGVHAERQAASLIAGGGAPTGVLARRLRFELPADIRLRELEEVEPGFDARRDALWREYRYEWPGSSPMAVTDLARMRRASSTLPGERDFAALSSVGELGPRGSIRRLLALEIGPGAEGGARSFRIVADAFLRQMARRLVSALLLVGTGRIGAAELLRALALRDRRLLPGPAPTGELTLVQVGYGEFRG
jgi:tRNA pseudouridine38-40 synthase